MTKERAQSAGKASWRGWLVAAALFAGVLVGGIYLLGIDEREQPPALIEGPAIDWTLLGRGHPEYWYGSKPNLDGLHMTGVWTEPKTGRQKELDFRVSTNELGLRDKPITEKGDRYRILALGSSTTFGHGVNNDEAWPAVLEANLLEAGCNVDVINCGFTGHTAFQGKLFLEHVGLSLKPDLVLISYGHNAPSIWDNISDYERHELQDPNEPSWNLSEEQAELIRERKAAFEAAAQVEGERPEPIPRLTHEQYTQALHELAAMANEAGAQAAFITWPIQYNFVRLRKQLAGKPLDGELPLYFDVTIDAARAIDKPLFNVLDVVGTDESVLMDNVHFTPKGNRMVGEALAEWLRDRGYFKNFCDAGDRAGG